MMVNNIGKSVTGTELLTSKKTKLSLKGAEMELLEQTDAMVSKTYPELEVIHPHSYQSVAVMNPKRFNQGSKGKNARVVVYKDRVYLA